jgi:hypothetical protein
LVETDRKIGLAAFYNLLYRPRGFGLAPHHYPVVMGLEDKRIDSLFLLAPPGTGKSNLLDIAYPLWEIGHNPALTVQSISAGEALPQGFMNAVMQIVQHDKNFLELFPDVRPDSQQGWSVGRGLFVTGHPASDPDPSYKAFGIASKALTGGHCRLQILDDLHDRENASTAESRQVIKNTYYDTIMGRADPRGCRRVAAGRWWAPDDVYQEWRASGDWVVLELPAVRSGSVRLWYDVYVPRGLQCVYSEMLEPEPPELQDEASPYVRYRAYYGAVDGTGKGFYWPASPSKRQEYERIDRRQPRTAAINYRGDMTGGGEGIFDKKDFRYYAAPEGLELGVQDPNVRAWIASLKGYIEDAWDTALGQPQSSSLTAALTGLLAPCTSWHCGEDEDIVGKCDFHYDVMLTDLMLKHLKFDELSKELRIRFGKWHPRRVNIEEKSSGVSLLQTFRGSQIPVRGIKVPRGKVERAVNAVVAGDAGKPIPGGAASVQGWWGMGRVSGPAGAEWLDKGPDGSAETGFLSRVCSFTGGDKASDEFDALVHLVTRAIMLSRQTARFGNDMATGPTDEEIALRNDDDPRRLVLNAFSQAPVIAGLSSNPLQGMCMAPCGHYGIQGNREHCFLHGRDTNSLSGCGQWTSGENRRIM